MSLLNNKYLFVHINKSGGGTITNNMKNNGETKITGMHRTLPDMLDIAKTKHSLDINSIFTFTMVRNPFDRMLSMYLYYKKHDSKEFFSGKSHIDNEFNNWIEYIYSGEFDRTRKHGGVNVFNHCFCNQLNWLKDYDGKLMDINKILKYENNEYDHLYADILKLSKYDSSTIVHPTNHAHYSQYYTEKSIELVSKHYQEDLDYFDYNFEYKFDYKFDIKSYSQYKQEEFVLNYFNDKKDGVFIELGGLDGIRHSNTFLLETKYNWNGLIIEPSPSLYKELKINRNVCTENILVGDTKQENIEFLYIEDKTKCIGLQGVVENYHPQHLNRAMRELNNKSYEIIKMDMVTLQQLCDKHNISKVDYLSLDVEGSELKVLKGIDFAKLDIKLIGVEINYKSDEAKIYDILNKNGYTFLKKCGDYFFTKK
jgi:FkbM family methyltransferase